jgi:cell division protein ZapA
MEKRQLKIDLLGTSFVIQSQESPEYLDRLCGFLRTKVDEVKRRYTFADPLTVALLAGLNLADELFKQREGASPSPLQGEIAEVAQKLIDTINDELLEYTPYKGDDSSSE